MDATALEAITDLEAACQKGEEGDVRVLEEITQGFIDRGL